MVKDIARELKKLRKLFKFSLKYSKFLKICQKFHEISRNIETVENIVKMAEKS